ncbi:hypothetical protein BGZ61DRAFT_467423 [Ilyonectria robusta]|uniref:uncharacterized protein n=1 Tax=Ilyonectria robusta TaxID=1079257 RepID=UPI001E8E0415|nr:uncharacterized protein BGZ61DRAFT_467423 [Ilyonectria robusta]KAH8654772.1 hypothetical protein BGZ61DRAFT_467423 [Ilyonectria robusta]
MRSRLPEATAAVGGRGLPSTQINTKSISACIISKQNKTVVNFVLFCFVRSAGCNCGEGQQTVAHILFQCRKHTALRNKELGQFPGHRSLIERAQSSSKGRQVHGTNPDPWPVRGLARGCQQHQRRPAITSSRSLNRPCEMRLWLGLWT